LIWWKAIYPETITSLKMSGPRTVVHDLRGPLPKSWRPMNWIDSHSRVDEGAEWTFGKCRIYPLLFASNLVVLATSQQCLQNAVDQFSAACIQAGTKISPKRTDVLSLSGRPKQCTLQVSGNTLQQVKFKYLGTLRWYSRVTEIGTKRLILGFRKQTQFCVSFVAPWWKRELSKIAKLCF